MGLYKRGQAWWMSFSYKGKQHRIPTESKDKQIAEKIFHKVMTEIAEGKWFEKAAYADKTLADLMEKYLNEHSKPNKAASTVKTDTAMVNEIKETLGTMLLVDVTPSLISSYKTKCREKGLSPASINARRTLLRHAFNLAIREWQWCKENPVEQVSREKVKNERDRWLTLEEESKLLECCVLHPTRKGNETEPLFWLQEIVAFALNTGMRQDEILSLEWQNVDLFRKTVLVVRSKNGEKRTIPMNQKLFVLLKEKAKGNRNNDKYVFPSEAGTKILRRNLMRAFYLARDRAKIDNFTFHDLRHTFATRLAQAGIDLYMISKLLGHKDIKMTQRYSHHCPDSLRSGVEVLDRISTDLAQSNEKGLAVLS
jgi:integrase